jgi:hypothetical protein
MRARELAKYCNANNMASCNASFDARAVEQLIIDELQNLNDLPASALITFCSGWRFYVVNSGV